MGKLITVVGNTGVGKTTLTQLLAEQGQLFGGLEQIGERPFQALFAQDLTRYALANQVDYLLLRAEQEWTIRRQPITGIQDGGLDLDFQLFTRSFYQKGYLSTAEFDLCERFYTFCRHLLPPPDLIIHLTAPPAVIAQRYRRRNRPLEIAQVADLAALERLLAQWLATVTTPVIVVDATADDPAYQAHLPCLLERIATL
jgi:deoxyadenosine/deoxycytidine kinase